MSDRILIMDANPGVGDFALGLLERQGYEVVTTPSTAEAVDHAYKMKPDLVVLVLSRNGTEGLRWARTVCWVHGCPVLVLAERPTAALLTELADLPFVAEVLRRPVPAPCFLSAVDKALASREFLALT